MAVVEYEVKNKIAYITLNRPEALNAIDGELFNGIIDTMERCSADPDAWVAILSGKGRAFCTGADLKGMGGGKRPGDVKDLYFSVLHMKKPLIVALHGFCLAQGEGLAFCSDIRVGAEGTEFGWPQVSRGITSVSAPTFGVHFLPRNVGSYLAYTAKRVGCDEMLKHDFLNFVVPPDQLMAKCEEIAGDILKNAPLAVWGTKEAIIKGMEMNLEQRMDLAMMIFQRVRVSEDTK
jgi:enoyl-CoA hydratase/carnithine racemase